MSRTQISTHPGETELPERYGNLDAAREAIADCHRCPLYQSATQAVFGEGQAGADVLFVGEQPGDREDIEGRPFVGPAGKLFDTALEEAGIARDRAYVTNAVKHFKFVPRGKKRLHQKPNAGEISACRFWLNIERDLVRPKVVVALGATALQALLGRSTTISSLRGQPARLDDGTTLVVTIHPSALLRMPDRERAHEEQRRFVADLRLARNLALH